MCALAGSNILHNRETALSASWFKTQPAVPCQIQGRCETACGAQSLQRGRLLFHDRSLRSRIGERYKHSGAATLLLWCSILLPSPTSIITTLYLPAFLRRIVQRINLGFFFTDGFHTSYAAATGFFGGFFLPSNRNTAASSSAFNEARCLGISVTVRVAAFLASAC